MDYEKQLEQQNEELKNKLAVAETELDDIIVLFIALSVSAYERYASRTSYGAGQVVDIDKKISQKVKCFKTLRKNRKINKDAEKILDKVKVAYSMEDTQGASP